MNVYHITSSDHFIWWHLKHENAIFTKVTFDPISFCFSFLFSSFNWIHSILPSSVHSLFSFYSFDVISKFELHFYVCVLLYKNNNKKIQNKNKRSNLSLLLFITFFLVFLFFHTDFSLSILSFINFTLILTCYNENHFPEKYPKIVIINSGLYKLMKQLIEWVIGT